MKEQYGRENTHTHTQTQTSLVLKIMENYGMYFLTLQYLYTHCLNIYFVYRVNINMNCEQMCIWAFTWPCVIS